MFYPLTVLLCEECLLVQFPMYVTGEHFFSDYAYFSSSDSWVAHAKRYADGMTATLGFTSHSFVTEVASNDSYLPQHFSAAGIPVLGIEPVGLRVIDVEVLSTHDGSLRVHAQPAEEASEPSERMKAVLDAEAVAGLHTVAGHDGFAGGAVLRTKSNLVEFLIAAARGGKSVAGYSVPGKGNTLLNHCGIRSSLLAYNVDRPPVKQGKFPPGTQIPIYPPERTAQTKPDCILVLPWIPRDEISEQLSYAKSWGRLIFPIPAIEVS